MADPAKAPARLEMELVIDESRVSGRLRRHGEDGWRPFTGWVGMSGALVDAHDGIDPPRGWGTAGGDLLPWSDAGDVEPHQADADL
jgi:hypothetical protein